MEKLMKNRNKRNIDLLFFILLSLTSILFLFKCRFGIANIDESFYLTVPLRIIQGDALFTEEWNLSQTSAVFLVPFVKLYLAIHHSTEGILLAARYNCIIIQAFVCIFLYERLKPYSKKAAFLGAYGFFLYIPFSINALSYNSMSIFFLEVALILALNHEKRISLILAGVFYGMSVLCIPQLVILYFIYLGVVIIENKKQKRLKDYFIATAGVAIVAVCFLAFILSRASFQNIMAALPAMLEDPTHQSKSIGKLLVSYIVSVYQSNALSPVIFSVYLGLLLVLWIVKSEKVRKTCFTLLCIWAVISAGYFALSNRSINYILYPVNLLVPAVIAMTENKDIHQLFHAIWIPGMLFGYCLNLASDQAFYAISSASSTALPATLAILVLYSEETDVVKIRRLIPAVIVVQLSLMLGLRTTQVFWEIDIRAQNTLMTEGPEKGLLTTPGKAEKYEALLQETAEIRQDPSVDKAVYLTDQTWMYLVNPAQKNASYSAWMADINDLTFSRLKKYYELNPDQMPDAVYIPSAQAENLDTVLGIWPYEAEDTADGMILRREKS